MSTFNLDNFFSLRGKVALVTGGARGLGLNAATTIALAGARTVFLAAENEAEVDAAAIQLNDLIASNGLDGRAVGIACDVTDIDSIFSLVDKVQTAETELHILVSSAGDAWGGPLESLSKAFAPILSASSGTWDPSRIIVLSSTADTLIPHVGENGTTTFSASKAAAAHRLCRDLATELGPKRITCNAVASGFFPSAAANRLMDNMGGMMGAQDSKRGKFGMPEDMAGAILYLTSRAGNYISGEFISVDAQQEPMALQTPTVQPTQPRL